MAQTPLKLFTCPMLTLTLACVGSPCLPTESTTWALGHAAPRPCPLTHAAMSPHGPAVGVPFLLDTVSTRLFFQAAVSLSVTLPDSNLSWVHCTPEARRLE